MQYIKIQGGGGSNSSTTSTKVEIPAEFQPYLYGTDSTSGILPGAEALYNKGQLAPVAGYGKTTQQALQSGKDLASSISSDTLPQLQNLFSSMTNQQSSQGDLLNNAMKAATADLTSQYERTTTPSLQDAAMAAGQFGSSKDAIATGLAKSELDKNILNTNAQMQYNALQSDLNRTLQGQSLASSFAPTLLNSMQLPMNLLSNVGSAEDTLSQAQASSQANNLTAYSELIRSLIPGTSSATTASANKNLLTSGLGGAASGAALGSLIMPGVGTGVGAGIGGLLGLFG